MSQRPISVIAVAIIGCIVAAGILIAAISIYVSQP